jgi:hypothetical protein
VTYLSLGWPANKKFRRRIEGAMKVVRYRRSTAEALNLAELQTKLLVLVISAKLTAHRGLQLRVAVQIDAFRQP